jgi:hypothetical protein
MFRKGFLKNKKGDANLLWKVLSVLLVLVVLSGFLLFLHSKINGAVVLEQSYSKNIALLIDASTPVMDMKLNMDKAFDLAEKNKIPRDDIVKIKNNTVTVRLSQKGGYSYSFFNDVDVSAYADIYPNKNYIIKINGYK